MIKPPCCSYIKSPMTTINETHGEFTKTSKTKAYRDEAIGELLTRNPVLWRGCDMSGLGNYGQPTGYPQLDDILPGRGWPHNAIVEIVSQQWGMGELQLLVPLMREIVRQDKWILWISPPYLLNSPALLQAGIDPEQILVINLNTSCKDALWSMEKALQTGSCGLVLAWQNWLPDRVVRRLQLAAETGKTLGVLFQHRISKYSQSFLRLEVKKRNNKKQQRRIGKRCERDQLAANWVETRQGDYCHKTEIVVLKARGNFRPLSVQLNLYPENLPHQQPDRYNNP